MLGGNSLKSLFGRLVLAGGCLLLVAAAAACGGSGDNSPTPSAVASPEATIEPLPTIDPNVPLVEYRSDLGYSISYPEGWDATRATPSTPFAGFTWSLSARPIAQLTVNWSQGQNQTIDSLMALDAAILPRGGGVMPAESTPVQAGGLPGKEVTYTTSFGGLPIEQVVVYVVKGDIGWRIGLATYGGTGSLQQSLGLFDRIIASFRPD
jgi:hypothetical protein